MGQERGGRPMPIAVADGSTFLLCCTYPSLVMHGISRADNMALHHHSSCLSQAPGWCQRSSVAGLALNMPS